MATLTNKAANTGTLTNKEVMVETSDMTWDEATFPWDGGGGTWTQPIGIANKALNTATMTNKSISV